ncbi:MAG: DUF5615 family PIN-like protein [Blastochloris sp.]|nr:DUF5615 family PIN-like protein [Blastochloris sp.]
MKLLVDVCLSPDWSGFLTSHDIPSLHWSSLGPIRAEDRIIFQYAVDHKCIVFTHDLDFGTLLAHSGLSKPSVIQARVENPTPEFIGSAVLTVLSQFAVELNQGAIITILNDRTKVRILPI